MIIGTLTIMKMESKRRKIWTKRNQRGFSLGFRKALI
jgi:hypothetical protein